MITAALLLLSITSFTAGDPLVENCGSSGNYTANGTYHANLVLLSTTLSSNAYSAPFLFAKGLCWERP